MTGDEKFNKLGLVNRGLESTPDYGCIGEGLTEVEFNTPRYIFVGEKVVALNLLMFAISRIIDHLGG